MKPIDIILDMETADPDDVMTLCLAIHHPMVRLRAVTVTPGTDEQVGLVRHILKQSELDIPVGSYRIGYDKNCVSGFHYKWIGKIQEASPDDEGYKIIEHTIKQFPHLTLLTGAPLKNMSKFSEDIQLERWVAQGGFAGDNVVPESYRLDKFKGMLTCPTFNFNGDPSTAERLLKADNVLKKYMVSKNVCHGVVYDAEMHEQFEPFRHDSYAMNLAFKGMDIYLKRKPRGKKFHDPLALAAAIELSVCEFKEVEMYRKRGGWGAELKTGSNTFISIKADTSKMIRILTGQEG